MVKVNWWAATFAAWTALYAGIVMWVTIPDYPRDVPLWVSLCWDKNGYWHEIWYITAAWLSGSALIALALLWATLRDHMRTVDAFLKMMMEKV